MAIALVGTIGTAVQTAATTALTTWAWGTSENRTAGNLLIAFVTVTGSATLPTTPANWNIGVQKAGTSCSATIYWKKAAGSDGVPTINAITSGLIAGQLSEWSGALAVVDQSGSASGTTSPNTATAGGANRATAELILMAAADRRSVARASNDTWTSNDGTVTAAGNINGTSSTDHYSFGYIASSTATTAQTSVVTLSITTSITGIANVNVSFPQPAPQTPAPTAASLVTTLGTPVIGAGLATTGVALTLSPSTPTVVTTNNVLVQPTSVALAATGATLTVATPVAVAPSAAALIAAGATPTVATPVVTQPTAASLALSPATPAVAAVQVYAPTAAALVTSGATPTVTAPAVSLPSAASLTTSGATPDVEIGAGNILVLPSAGALTAAGATPDVSTPVLALPAEADLLLAGATPAVVTPISVSPAALALVLSMGTPAVLTGTTVLPTAASLALTPSTPTVAVTANILVQPAALALAIMFATPAVTGVTARGGKHVKRMRPPVTGTSLPPSEEDEEFLALLEAFDG